MADVVSTGSFPVLFKVLTLNVAICIVLLNFIICLSSVADFSKTEAKDQTLANESELYILVNHGISQHVYTYLYLKETTVFVMYHIYW